MSNSFPDPGGQSVEPWNSSTYKAPVGSNGLPMAQPPYPFPLCSEWITSGNQPLPIHVSNLSFSGVPHPSGVDYKPFQSWPQESNANSPLSVVAANMPTSFQFASKPVPFPASDVAPSSTVLLQKNVNRNSAVVECYSYTTPHVQSDNPSWTSNQKIRSPNSWLLDKYLKSVQSAHDLTTDAVSLTQNTHQPNLSQSSPNNMQPFVRRSPQYTSNSANRREGTLQTDDLVRAHHLPVGNLNVHSTDDGEMRVSSSKTRKDEKLTKDDSHVSESTLTAWTEYFKKLYAYNLFKHKHGDATRTQGFDSHSVPAIEPSRSNERPSVNTDTRQMVVSRPKLLTKTADKDSVAFGFRSSVTVSRDPTSTSTAKPSSLSSVEPRFGCTVCGLTDANWTTTDFEKHINSEVHRQRYKSLYSSSINSHTCKVCGHLFGDNPSQHNLKHEHLQGLALLQRGCPTCKIRSFKVYEQYVNHMNRTGHNHLQTHRNQVVNSSRENFRAADSSVNIVDSTQDKKTNFGSDISDSSQNFDGTTCQEDSHRSIKSITFEKERHKTNISSETKFHQDKKIPAVVAASSTSASHKKSAIKRDADKEASPESSILEICPKRVLVDSSPNTNENAGSKMLMTTTTEPSRNSSQTLMEAEHSNCDDIFEDVRRVYCKICKITFDATKLTRRQHCELAFHQANIQKLRRKSSSLESSTEKPRSPESSSEVTFESTSSVKRDTTPSEPASEPIPDKKKEDGNQKETPDDKRNEETNKTGNKDIINDECIEENDKESSKNTEQEKFCKNDVGSAAKGDNEAIATVAKNGCPIS